MCIQLSQSPEPTNKIFDAKNKCNEFELEIMEYCEKSLLEIELEIRSWTKGDDGDAHSFIRMNSINLLNTSQGINCVIIDKNNIKTKLSQTFNINNDYKLINQHKQDFNNFLNKINDTNSANEL